MRQPHAADGRATNADRRDPAGPLLALTSTWSIQSKLIAVLAVPVVALVALWAVATWVTLGPGLALLDARDSVETVGRPAQNLIAELQSERKLTAGYLAGDRSDDSALTGQYRRTDAAVADFRDRADTGEARSALTASGSDRLDELLRQLSALPRLRDGIDGGSVQRPEAQLRYTEVVESALALARSLIRPSTEDLLREGQALATLSEARELLARQDAILTGAITAGAFTSAELSQTVQLIGARRHQTALALADLQPADRDAYLELAGREAAAILTALDDRLIVEARASQPVPIDGAATERRIREQILPVLAEQRHRVA